MSGPGPELDAFVERYVAVWNEPDAAARRRMIEELWTPDGANFSKSNEWRGCEALEARVRGAHEKWVRDGGYLFRRRRADGHHGAVLCVWDMTAIADGRVLSVGTEYLLLGRDGRIPEDYQFIKPPAQMSTETLPTTRPPCGNQLGFVLCCMEMPHVTRTWWLQE